MPNLSRELTEYTVADTGFGMTELRLFTPLAYDRCERL